MLHRMSSRKTIPLDMVEFRLPHIKNIIGGCYETNRIRC